MESKRLKTSDLSNLKKLITICEKANITRLKFDNFEIEFSINEGIGEKKPKKRVSTKEQAEPILNNDSQEMPSDEAMLFAATPHFENMLNKEK